MGDQISRSLRRAQDTAALWNKENHTHHGSLTELNFRANPSAFYDHYSALKNASLIHQKSVRHEQYYPGSMNVDQLYEFGKQDIHTIPVNGISIDDIEAMHPPLSMDNLTAISKVFRKPFLKKPTKEQDFAETTLILLATLPQAQPEKASKIPRNIQNLTEVTQDFFDYYISFLKNGFQDSADELEYLNSLFFRKSKRFVAGISIYLPARLGISPSSALKLIDQQAVFSEVPGGKRAWHALKKSAEHYMPGAYPAGNLSKNLEGFLMEDKARDNQASAFLESWYSTPVSNKEQEGMFERKKQSMKDYLTNTRFKLINLLKNGSKTYTYPGHGPIESITAAQLYKQTVIFITRFTNGSYLTIEIGNDGSVYGIPPEVLKKIPHIHDVLVPEILSITFPEREKSHPIVLQSNQPQVILFPERTSEMNPDTAKPKKKRLRILQGTPETELPTNPAKPEKEKHVSYSDEVIRGFMHGKKTDPNLVSKARTMLYRFEMGWKDPKALSAQNDRKLFSLRTGDMVIVLEHSGEDRYNIITIGDREDAYKEIDPTGYSN